MDEELNAGQHQLPLGVGDRLRAAREKMGLTVAQVAAETRINQRHISMIEAGDFASLPARAYAVGFSRTYAKVVGLDDAEIAREVRGELAMIAPRDNRALTFEPGDPLRVPSARLAWFSAFAALIVILGVGIFVSRFFFAPEAELPFLTEQETATPAPAVAPAASPNVAPTAGGEVVFTSLEDGIWVKFYDQNGAQLMQKQMAKGETYAVPAAAAGPQLWTGRPDALTITVGGRAVPAIAEREQIVRDVPVSAQALLARPQQGAQPVVQAPPTI